MESRRINTEADEIDMRNSYRSVKV